MKKKASLALAALLAIGQGVWAQTQHFIIGGTADNPFLIKTTNDLNNLASDVNSGTDYNGRFFKLNADLDFSNTPLFDSDEDGKADSNFIPIGMIGDEDNIPFKGIFDGDGHTIKGIVVNQPSGMGIGLFGCIMMNATIKNLTLSQSVFTGNVRVGGLVGEGTGSHTDPVSIENCHVDETVKVTGMKYIDDEEYPGSLVGGIIGYCDMMKVKDCQSKAKVKGDESVGGVVGLLTGTNLAHSTLSDCFYLGEANDVEAATDGGLVIGTIDNSVTDIHLTLLDNDSKASVKNTTRISNYKGLEANVTLGGHILYKDGTWNTLCLPFGFTVSGSALNGATVKTLKATKFTDGTLTLIFTEGNVDKIVAGMPYIVKWESGGEFTPTFEGVTISSVEPSNVTGDDAIFHGIYTPYTTGGVNKSMLYLGAGDKLYYPNKDMTINAFRAYFTLKGITAGETAKNGVNAIMLNFGEGATGIENVQTPMLHPQSETWHTLDGRLLSGKPAQPGLYIRGGRKVVVK